MTIRAVLWDFGGVILSSPFEAFNRYEERHGLPRDFVRGVNSQDPDHNAWARLERSEVTPVEFDELFANESARLGHRIPGADVLALLTGELRPRMVAALDSVLAAGYLTACLTNNVLTGVDGTDDDRAGVLRRFHAVIESSKIGARKPEPLFYETACRKLAVEPSECVFLDDLGVNLKPAATMGMKTIKVVDPDVALAELSEVLGVPLP